MIDLITKVLATLNQVSSMKKTTKDFKYCKIVSFLYVQFGTFYNVNAHVQVRNPHAHVRNARTHSVAVIGSVL